MSDTWAMRVYAGESSPLLTRSPVWPVQSSNLMRCDAPLSRLVDRSYRRHESNPSLSHPNTVCARMVAWFSARTAAAGHWCDGGSTHDWDGTTHRLASAARTLPNPTLCCLSRRIELRGGALEGCSDAAVEEARIAPVAWAQRTDRLYLTIQVTECSKPTIRVEPSGKLHFAGLCGPNQLMYSCDLELYGAVDPDVRPCRVA
jgi:hypothetical protein